MRRTRAGGTLVMVLWAVGCGKPGDAASTGDSGPSTSDPPFTTAPIVAELAPCGFLDTPSGLVDVARLRDAFHAEATAVVAARLQERRDPPFHTVAQEVGGCRLLARTFGDCDPSCVAPATCTAESACESYPSTVGAGTLRLEGLAASVDMTAYDFAPGVYDGPGGLPGELFEPGATVGLRASGGEIEALHVGATGVAPMDDALVDAGLVLSDVVDTVVSWTAGPDPGACVQLKLYSANASHGAPLEAIVQCEGPDTGEIVVPAALVAAFPLGTTLEVTEGYDWPHSELTRYTRARTDTSTGPLELRVRSTTTFLYSHPGGTR